jgi:hypothetical protein
MRIRFALRELFWVTLFAAVVSGWWLDRRALEQRLDRDQRLIWLDQTKIGALKSQITLARTFLKEIGFSPTEISAHTSFGEDRWALLAQDREYDEALKAAAAR